jgi:polysaccharide export outer membrane protein
LKVLVLLRGQRYVVPCVVLALLFHRVSPIAAQDLSVVGTPQQANDRIRSLSEAASKNSVHEYTIGNGDLLSISVFDVPELSRDLRVSQLGTISIPLVPARLHVSGLTELQASQKIADVLEADGLVSHPDVGVTVKERRSKPITVVGAVQHAMVYEADHGVTLLEVLAEAGGVSNDAGDTILITRHHPANFVEVPNPDPVSGTPPGAAAALENSNPLENSAGDSSTSSNHTSTVFPSATELKQDPSQPAAPPADNKTESGRSDTPASNIITVNLNELLETGDTRNNIPLQAGDIVTVPHAGIVYVLGAVTRPGGFVLINDRTQMTTLKILALAGGFTRTAKTEHAVIIRKDDQGKQTQTEVDLKKVLQRQSEDIQMHASDILYVPESRGKQIAYQAMATAVGLALAVAIYRVAYH